MSEENNNNMINKFNTSIIYNLILDNLINNDYPFESIKKGIEESLYINYYPIDKMNTNIIKILFECQNRINKDYDKKYDKDKFFSLGLLIGRLTGICGCGIEKHINYIYYIRNIKEKTDEIEYCNCGNGNCFHILNVIPILERILNNFNYSDIIKIGYYENYINKDFYDNYKPIKNINDYDNDNNYIKFLNDLILKQDNYKKRFKNKYLDYKLRYEVFDKNDISKYINLNLYNDNKLIDNHYKMREINLSYKIFCYLKIDFDNKDEEYFKKLRYKNIIDDNNINKENLKFIFNELSYNYLYEFDDNYNKFNYNKFNLYIKYYNLNIECEYNKNDNNYKLLFNNKLIICSSIKEIQNIFNTNKELFIIFNEKYLNNNINFINNDNNLKLLKDNIIKLQNKNKYLNNRNFELENKNNELKNEINELKKQFEDYKNKIDKEYNNKLKEEINKINEINKITSLYENKIKELNDLFN